MNNPNNTQIELVEGCNRMCDFCGIHGIWKEKAHRKINFMSLELASKIAEDFSSWFDKKRIEFAMHGEPTLHPKLFDIISLFRKHLQKAQLQLTSNGIVILKKGKDFVHKLFENGLNILILDIYDKKHELLNVCNEVINSNKEIKLFDYYSNKEFNPYHYKGHNFNVILLFDDLAKTNKKRPTRIILNHAGNSSIKNLRKYGILPINSPLQKKCSRPFRELVIHYDGTIPFCCLDWKHESILAKFPEDGSLEKIWNDAPFNFLRFLLFNKVRTLRPCYKCDYNGGFRLGFLKEPQEFFESSIGDILFELKGHLKNYEKFKHSSSNNPIMYTRKNIYD
jgi:MoaA/NifB/PqqE/SkfB family radical SAM enzyme